MAKKSLGYVELEWTCPNCGTKNPGTQRTCQNCGAPQPDNVQFEQSAQEQLIEDEAKIAQAKAGPDIHCYYCGTRNPGNAERCSQCGADLSEGAQRQYGQILGAHRDKAAPPIICPSCGTPNEPDAPTCASCGSSLVQPEPQKASPPPAPQKQPSSLSKFWKVGLIVIALLCAGACITFFILSNQTEDLTGTVQAVNWSRTITIEGLRPVEYEAWVDQIPDDGTVGTCEDKVRRVQDNPAPNSREVCGTPYTVDAGSGYGEVVQDCRYEIFEKFCAYTVDEWGEVDQVVAEGDNFSPQWPALNIGSQEREGERDEVYRCVFSTESGQYTYTTGNQAEFNQCEIGSRWILTVNALGGVNDIEPLR